MFLTSLVRWVTEKILRTVSVFDKSGTLGDRENHCQNQASQLTVSALDNERTGVIFNKQKRSREYFYLVRSALVIFNKLEFAKRVVSDSESIG